MDSKEINGSESLGKVENKPEEVREVLGGIPVVLRNRGGRIVWLDGELLVNMSLYNSGDEGRMAVLRQVGGLLGLREDRKINASLLRESKIRAPEATESILRWHGLRMLRENNPEVSVPVAVHNQTFKQELEWALDVRALTGNYPDTLSEQVRGVLGKMRRSPAGSPAIDVIASRNYTFKIDTNNFGACIKPLLDEAGELDRQTGRSRRFEYSPSQPQDIATTKEEIQESDITRWVEPAYGGYYLGRSGFYDPVEKKVVYAEGVKSVWEVDDPPDDAKVMSTLRTYHGRRIPGEETVLPLPLHALPLISTLNPPGVFRFMRDDFVTVYIEPRGQEQVDAEEFSFGYVKADTLSTRLSTRPEGNDTIPAGGELDEQTKEFLDDLATQSWMSSKQKTREIDRFLRKMLVYPQDESDIPEVDDRYILLDTKALWREIGEVKVAHCYWVNILACELYISEMKLQKGKKSDKILYYRYERFLNCQRSRNFRRST